MENASVREKALELIERQTKLAEDDARDLEKGVYNWCIRYAKEQGIVKAWSNPTFVALYADKARSVVANLDEESYLENTRLMARLRDKEFVPHEIPFMNPQSVHPELWREIVDIKTKKDENLGETMEQPMTDQFKCGRCKSRACVYREIQLRSADEPANIIPTMMLKVAIMCC